jgi:hypothetical protein
LTDIKETQDGAARSSSDVLPGRAELAAGLGTKKKRS